MGFALLLGGPLLFERGWFVFAELVELGHVAVAFVPSGGLVVLSAVRDALRTLSSNLVASAVVNDFDNRGTRTHNATHDFLL